MERRVFTGMIPLIPAGARFARSGEVRLLGVLRDISPKRDVRRKDTRRRMIFATVALPLTYTARRCYLDIDTGCES